MDRVRVGRTVDPVVEPGAADGDGTGHEDGPPVTASVLPRGVDESNEMVRSLRLWIALARAYGTVARRVATKVAEYDLTTAQFGILEALHHLGQLTLGDLAEKLLVTGGNVTYVMDRLQREGLVSRRRCSQDRRVVWAELTPDGRALMEEIFPDHAAFVHDTVGVLDDAEQAQLRGLLKKLGKGIVAAEDGL